MDGYVFIILAIMAGWVLGFGYCAAGTSISKYIILYFHSTLLFYRN
jgi:hypothetical protein